MHNNKTTQKELQSFFKTAKKDAKSYQKLMQHIVNKTNEFCARNTVDEPTLAKIIEVKCQEQVRYRHHCLSSISGLATKEARELALIDFMKKNSDAVANQTKVLRGIKRHQKTLALATKFREFMEEEERKTY